MGFSHLSLPRHQVGKDVSGHVDRERFYGLLNLKSRVDRPVYLLL